MAQTQLNYNQVMFSQKGTPFRYRSGVITGAADLAVGTVLVEDDATGSMRAAVDADKVNTGAAAVDSTWAVLLEAAAVSGGDLTRKYGVSGGVFSDKLVGVGLTLDLSVYKKLEMNNIYVIGGTNSVAVAGEGA